MKKIIIILIIFIPFSAFSQFKRIDGFLNLPFGTDSASVKKALLAKDATENYNLTGKDIIVFNYFKFNDRNVFSCTVKFFKNKAYEADFVFNEFAQTDVLSYYDSLAADITSVYGGGEFTNNFRKSENNSTRVLRLQSGQETGETLWLTDDNKGISLKFRNLNSVVYIDLIYQDITLLNMSRGKKVSDF